MPNQLAIPFKKTYNVEIKAAVSDFLQQHTESHPNAFKWDISRWRTLRGSATDGVVHVDRIADILCYHAQLLSILAKFPTDIGLDFPYTTAFSTTDLPITLRDLAFERAAVIFNLAALYSQLAVTKDRSSRDGVKRAMDYYQSAAGTLAFLNSSAIPKIHFSPDDDDGPLDLTEPFIKSLEWLMLAQAQECAWQRTLMDNYKNGFMSKLAASVASFYNSSLSIIITASSSVRRIFPSFWIPHLAAKMHHFQAVAQFRKSMDDLEGNRHGLELARLAQAHIDAKKAYDYAKRPGVAPAVLHDIQSLLNTVQKNYDRAERDNNLIYHQEVPASSILAQIQEIVAVSSVVPVGLENPKSVLKEKSPLFDALLGWGAREAINIYAANRKLLLKENVIDAAQTLSDRATETLRSLNLPSALEALERPVGLPPSILRNAEEIRMEKGPNRIETSIEDVQKLARYNTKLLDEAMDILDNEASEDEAASQELSVRREPSFEANRGLVLQEKRYRVDLEQAAASDELVRQKWDRWETKIRDLCRDESQLIESVPSSTIHPNGIRSSTITESQSHSRALRALLETLDDLRRARAELVERAQRLSATDDIRPQIIKLAGGIEPLTEAKPLIFEEVCDEELAKYDKFIQGIAESEQKQNDVLAAIHARNELFLQSRREDVTVKARQGALRSLDLAYQSYREITRNLDEGFKFYNDLARAITEFRDSCRSWSTSRKQELHALSRSIRSMSLRDVRIDDPEITGTQTEHSPMVVPSRHLPSVASDMWESLPLPPGPRSHVSPGQPLPDRGRRR